jgi:DNA-binding NarL/FixJ family response regulator
MGKTVLVVDDHSGFRASARQLLESEGFEVIGEAEDGESAVTKAEQLQPELALVDVYLPDVDGLVVASRLRGLANPPAVILISSHGKSEFDPLIPDSGARGFLPKSQLSREALEALL